MKRTIPGHVAMGPNTSTVVGVDAVESIPSHNLFSLCTPTECLDASIDQRDAKGGHPRSSASPTDAIVGEIERAPGESCLHAAAFTMDDAKQVRQKPTGGPQYRANDFTPYRRL
ncbi:g9175 [Coccomyxa elongata]